MIDLVYKLGLLIHTRNFNLKQQLHSYYYRHRHLLSKPCSEISPFQPISSPEHLKCVQLLAQYAPLHPADVSPDLSASLLELNRLFPPERRFYQNLQMQMTLWNKFSNRTLEEFLNSKEGVQWLKARKKLKRKALYELDIPFKVRKRSALAHEEKIRSLLRKNPLLRWEDLCALKISNAQQILRDFPFLKKHREIYLKKISNALAQS